LISKTFIKIITKKIQNQRLQSKSKNCTTTLVIYRPSPLAKGIWVVGYFHKHGKSASHLIKENQFVFEQLFKTDTRTCGSFLGDC
jgi:hypothetical protein